jgi:hypothetical protein
MSRHKNTSPLGHEWAQKCWSTKGMFDPSYVSTLTCVKTLEICVESVLPPYPNNLQ